MEHKYLGKVLVGANTSLNIADVRREAALNVSTNDFFAIPSFHVLALGEGFVPSPCQSRPKFADRANGVLPRMLRRNVGF
jgi:hypothetical protein